MNTSERFMSEAELIKLWNEMDEEDKKEFKSVISTKISDAAGETGKMREAGKISWKSYKVIMDEFVNQNPVYRLYLQGKLK